MSVSPSSSIRVYFMCFEALCLVHTHLGLLCLPGELTLLSLCNIPLHPYNFVCRGNGPVCPGLGRLLDESHKANQIVDHVHLLHDGKMGKPVFIEKDLTWAPASLHP